MQNNSWSYGVPIAVVFLIPGLSGALKSIKRSYNLHFGKNKVLFFKIFLVEALKRS